jgi:membrane-associated protease RseP (regulator of RpoE activity)
MMDPATIFSLVLIAWLVIYFIGQAIGSEKLKERGIDVSFPFFFMYRTQRLNGFLTRAGKKFPRVFFNIGIVAGFIGMALAFWMFAQNFITFIIKPAAAGGVVPIIPGITITGPSVVYLIVGLTVALIVHEFAHGFAASKDGVPIKSSGLLAFLVLGGAFVEPDEEVFEKETPLKSRMRLHAAGSFSNIIWAFFFVFLMANFATMMSIAYNPPHGAYVFQLEPESPASEVLEVGDVIIGLNDTAIMNWTAVGQFMADAPAGSQLTIHTLQENVTIILAPSELNASLGYMGVYGADYWEPKPGWDLFLGPMFAFHLERIIFWCYLINISLALFNLLPIPVLDGDKILADGIRLLTKDEKKVKYVMWPLRIASILIVVLSIVLSFIYGKGLF